MLRRFLSSFLACGFLATFACADPSAEVRERAEAGAPWSQYYLGLMCAQGISLSKDLGEALKWYRRSADQGTAIAQFSIGEMYETGTGVPKDSAEGVKWYRHAAEQGDPDAQAKLGVI
jgi:TPR repeat protein